MSNKMPMVALDKVEVKLSMRVETVVRLDRMAKELGIESRSAIINALIDEDVKDVQLEAEDLDAINDIMRRNLERRNALKAQKGIA